MIENILQLVTDPQRLRRILSQMQEIVDSPYRIAPSTAEAKQWAVVPVESASHFDEGDAQRIAEACDVAECEDCLAVATESIQNDKLCYRIQTTKEGLLAFSHECGHFNYLIFPSDNSFSILCTVKDYYLVAGPSEFVNKATGGSIESARAQFSRFARDEFWSQSERDFLLSIDEEYAAFNGG